MSLLPLAASPLCSGGGAKKKMKKMQTHARQFPVLLFLRKACFVHPLRKGLFSCLSGGGMGKRDAVWSDSGKWSKTAKK